MCPTLNYYISILFWQSCSDKQCVICHFFALFTIFVVVATTCASFHFYQIILMYIYLLVISGTSVKTILVFLEVVRGRGNVIIAFSGVVCGFLVRGLFLLILLYKWNIRIINKLKNQIETVQPQMFTTHMYNEMGSHFSWKL